MTQRLEATASAGGVMLLLTMVMASSALFGAAGDRGHQPTLVAGLLFAIGFVVVSQGRAQRDWPVVALLRGRFVRVEPIPSVIHGTGAETGARCAGREVLDRAS
jgi:hypothetical protein